MTETSRRPSNPQAWRVGSSSTLFAELDEATLRACESAGVECLELALFGRGVDPADPAGIRILEDRARRVAGSGLTLWSVHLPFGRAWDFTVDDAVQRERVVGDLQRLLALGAAWGAQVAVVHPSYEPIPDGERADRLARCKEELARLAAAAQAYGIRLAAECLPRTCLGNSSEEMAGLVEGIPGIGICFDSNHLLKERPEQFAARLGGLIATIHISDYDGVDERHWMPGRGVIDWTAVIGALAQAGYTGPFLFELSQKNAEQPITPADLPACWRRLAAAYAARPA